jgi:putative proteasome-type protease
VTYCLAMRLDAGLIFLSDTRTNAGLDNVGTFRKLHVIRAAPDRVFVLQSAGSLATTHEVLARLDRDLDPDFSGDHESLATVTRLFEAALYLGRVNKEVIAEHTPTVGEGARATFILGGQIAGSRPDILLVYPEGNFIHVSETVPFHQIGEAKYGKFLLELAVRGHVDLQTAVKIALGSMLSTAHANLAVGPPYDAAVYHNGSLQARELRIETDHPYLRTLNDVWTERLIEAVGGLPEIPDDLMRDGW